MPIKCFDKFAIVIGSLFLCFLISCNCQDEPSINYSLNKQKIDIFDNYSISDSAVYLQGIFEKSVFLPYQKEYIDYINKILKKKSSVIRVPIDYMPNGTGGDGMYFCKCGEIVIQIKGAAHMPNNQRLDDHAVFVSHVGFSLPLSDNEVTVKFNLGMSNGYNTVYAVVTNNVTFSYEGTTILQDTVLESYIAVLDFAKKEAIVNHKTIW